MYNIFMEYEDYTLIRDLTKLLKTSRETLFNECEKNNIIIYNLYNFKSRNKVPYVKNQDVNKLIEIYNLKKQHKKLKDILIENNISQDKFSESKKYLNINKSFKDLSDEEMDLILKYAKLPKKDKLINSYIKHYGSYENYVKCMTDKIKETHLKKYGVDNVFKSEIIKNKIKETNLKKYGVEHVLQNKEINKKMKTTIINKFGTDNVSKLESIKLKKENTRLNNVDNFKNNNGCVSLYDCGLSKIHSFKVVRKILKKHNIELIYDGVNPYIKTDDYEILINELDSIKYNKTSFGEKEVLDFVKSIYDGEIIENDRSIISPKELDIYIPSKNLAIEYDGLYYHSETMKIKYKYNIDLKTKLCEEKGIRLIHVFEDDWDYKQNIIKSIIASALGVYERKIYARKCEIKEVSFNESKLFLNVNHLNGSCVSSYRYGLYYNNELVMIMCFGKSRRSEDVELIRVCTKINIQVVGGFSKLLKHFEKNCNFKKITSFINRNQFNGNGYINNGFTIEHCNKPIYWWIKNNIRYNRENFQKKKLSKKLSNFDDTLSEKDNMYNNGYYRIFGCGTLKVSKLINFH